MEISASRSSLLDLPVDGPQGSIPRTSRQSQWPQALGVDVSRNPQGNGGSYILLKQFQASEAWAQPKPLRAVDEFFLFGDRLRAQFGDAGCEPIQSQPQ